MIGNNKQFNILVVRFRQMGDAILTTVVLNTLRKSFPNARIDFVLNKKIAPLFENHPSIDNIITFTDEERHSTLTYIRKVWHTVHAKHYDVIIDMRSTLNTMLFAMFSRGSDYRIGLRKSYARLGYNRIVNKCGKGESMIDHNLAMVKPLEEVAKIEYTKDFTLGISEEEIADFKTYMEAQGIDFSKPVMLAGVAAKLKNKMWAEDRMTWVIRQITSKYPDLQIIFNFAPNEEEVIAKRIYNNLGKPANIFVNIQANSMRKLAAMAANISIYFGNEGGARHIVQAMGKPSFVICAPQSSKTTWIPQNNVPAEAISVFDIVPQEQINTDDWGANYDFISQEEVFEKLNRFMDKHI